MSRHLSLRIFLVFATCLVMCFSTSLVALAASPGGKLSTDGAPSTRTNWDMFGFNLHHTHFNPNEKVLTPKNVSRLVIDWKATAGSFIDSSPAVDDGVVYVGSYDSKVYALNATTGAKLWSYTTGGSIDSSAAVTNGVVYIGSTDHHLYVFHLPGKTP